MSTETQAQFARRLGVVRSRVAAYKRAGRLVMVGDLVDVEASLASIQATRNASHDNQSKLGAGEMANGAANSAAHDKVPEGVEGGGIRRIDAQARREHLAAELLQIDLDEKRGKLMRSDDVISTVAESLTLVRTHLESMADLLAPQLVGISDENRVRGLIADHVEHALTDLSQRLRAWVPT